MSYFYPQAVCTLKIRWEDFGDKSDTILSEQDYKLTVLAKNITVTINDYTSADTFSAEFEYSNFPFDPRCIRALGITVHMEDKRSNFVGNVRSPDFNASNLITARPENTLFQGFADEESIEFDQENRLVKIEGRDFTSLLIDAPHNGNAVNIGQSIDAVVAGLLAELPSAREIQVVNKTGGELPALSKFYADRDELSDRRSSKNKESYWDVITDICQQAGLINYIELDKLIIAKPRNLFAGDQTYQFIYGKNVTSLSFKRKLGRQKGINILMRSLNIGRKEVLEAKIPEEATQEWSTATGVALLPQTIEKVDKDGKVTTETAPYMTFNVPNVSDKNQLIEIGQGVYEEIGRQQLEGKMSTRELAINVSGVEFDLLKMRIGTPIKIEIDQGDLKGIRRITDEAARYGFLVSRGYAPSVARAFARTMGKFSTLFYLKSVEFRMSNEDSLTVDIEFINFINLDNKLLGK